MSLTAKRHSASTFVVAKPSVIRQGRTALRGFKEDFEAWRASLSPEEQTMIQAQAEGEFNKNFRKSDEFKKDLPEEKMQAFSKVLKKFFDAEAEDYKKEEEAKTPDYNGLQKKAAQKEMDFSLKGRIVELDRDADRRYHFASQRIYEAERKGEKFPQSSPMLEKWVVKNDDEESHKVALQTLDFIKRAAEDKSCSEEAKPLLLKTVEKGVPPMGEKFVLLLPQVLVNQIHHMLTIMQKELAKWGEGKSKEEVDKYVAEKIPEIAGRVIQFLTKNYVEARDLVEKDVETMKNFYRSQKEVPGRTKADVLKEIWEELPKLTDQPVPPLDEEILAELAEEPAVVEGEFRHSWGTADKLYKSEAIDPFGAKILLGVFETKDEATKAFDDWNGEYETARAEMKEEISQWSKQEQARLDKDTETKERIKEILADAKA